MARKNRNQGNKVELSGHGHMIQRPVQTEEPKQPVPTYVAKVDYVGGGEPTQLAGLAEGQIQPLIDWYKGFASDVMVIPVGTGLLLIDRANVANLFIDQEVK